MTNIPRIFVNVPSAAKCCEQAWASPLFQAAASSWRMFRIAASSRLPWAADMVAKNSMVRISVVLMIFINFFRDEIPRHWQNKIGGSRNQGLSRGTGAESRQIVCQGTADVKGDSTWGDVGADVGRHWVSRRGEQRSTSKTADRSVGPTRAELSRGAIPALVYHNCANNCPVCRCLAWGEFGGRAARSRAHGNAAKC